MKIILSVNTENGEVKKLGEIHEESEIKTLGYIYLEETLKNISKLCNIYYSTLINSSKKDPVIIIRQIMFYIIYYKFKIQNLSLIGRLFNGFNHATVGHGIKVIERDVFKDKLEKYVFWYNQIDNYFKENDLYNKILII